MVPYLRAANVKDGELDLTDVKEMNFAPDEQRVFALQRGDVLVTEGSGSLRAVGASAVWTGEIHDRVCYQNTLLRLRPRPTTDPKFLAWWCRYAYADGVFASIATGANIFHISAERVRALPMTYLDIRRQRRIADYLDIETARLDALIAMKRRMIELLDERFVSGIDQLLAGSDLVPARRLANLLPGYAFASDDFSPTATGPRLLRGVNVGVGRVRWSEVVRLEATPGARADRYRLQENDIVVGMDRPFIGGGARIAVVGHDDAGAYLVQRVCRLRCHTAAMAPVIRWAFASPKFTAHVEPDLTGVSVPHLSDEQIGTFPVPDPPPAELEQLARQLRSAEVGRDALVRPLTSQVQLLQEHRQALITAAVTGDLVIPRVAA